MASSKVMPSSNSRNSDLSRRNSSSASSSSPSIIRPNQVKREPNSDRTGRSGGYGGFASAMTVDGIFRDVYGSDPLPPAESTLLDSSITLMDTSAPVDVDRSRDRSGGGNMSAAETRGKSVDEVWRDIVSGDRKEMKEEAPDEMMTLEDFLVKAGAVDDAVATAESEDMDLKMAPERLSGGVYAFDPLPPSSFQVMDTVEGSIVGYGNGAEVYGGGGAGGGGSRGKRGRLMMEPLDKAAAQRQRRMIKNRESAARSRERKQAHQVELESLAAKLEEENEQLSREKVERTKERYKKLMDQVIPVAEKRRPRRVLRRVCSLEW